VRDAASEHNDTHLRTRTTSQTYLTEYANWSR